MNQYQQEEETHDIEKELEYIQRIAKPELESLEILNEYAGTRRLANVPVSTRLERYLKALPYIWTWTAVERRRLHLCANELLRQALYEELTAG